MDEKLSKDQMIIETFLTVKQLEKRLDRHGAEHREDLEKLWESLKELNKDKVDLSQEHGDRLTKLESERGLLGRMINIIVALFAGGGGGYLGKHL